MKIYITLLLFGLFSSCIYSKAQQLSFIKYTVQDGLVANPVRCIYQDSKGFLWIGTFEGLSRYDGFRFTNYNTTNGLSHNFINSLIEADNKLLVAENNGAIDIIQNSTIQKGFKLNGAANAILTYKNRVLISTDLGTLFEYKNNNVFEPPQEKTGHSLGFFTGYNDSLMVIDGVDNELFIFTNELAVYASLLNLGTTFNGFVPDSKKRIWACTSGGLRLLKLPLTLNGAISFAPLPTLFDLPILKNSPVTSMLEEKDGSFWIGTDKGLVHLAENGDYKIYTEKDGLPSAYINTIYRDREQNIWLGTGLGLAKWVRKNSVTFYNANEGDFKNDIMSIFPLGDKNMILNTHHGLQHFNFDTKKIRDLPVNLGKYPLLVDESILSIILSGNTLSRFDVTKNIITQSKKLDMFIPEVYGGRKGLGETIFIASGKGLYVIENTTVKKLLPYRITVFTNDENGDIWVGTWMDGLYKVHIDTTGTTYKYDVENMTSFIDQKEIRKLYIDSKHNIWVGSRYGGAFKLTPSAGRRFLATNFNQRTGLMSDWVRSFAETANGDMWIGTYLGIDRLIKVSNGYRVFNFSRVTNFFAQVEQIIPVGDDNWVCVANSGIAYFKDEGLHKDVPLEASVLSVTLGLGDQKISLVSPKEKVYLHHRQNAARFDFSALGFINEKQVKYSYRLKGSGDSTWSVPENIHEASYASLSPGNYIFEVRTVGWNGEMGKTANFHFNIATPFWKQWWFIGLCLLIIGALVYALYRYRIQQLLRLQKIRNSIATDLHDDIGSALTNISILAEISRKKDSQRSFTESLPAKISEESALAQQALDDIIWSVNSKNDTLSQTIARMRRYAAEIFEPIGVNCVFDAVNVPDDQKLNMEQRKDIYLVFKECLNNIIKHAAATNVSIDISLLRNVLGLQIIDDGKGFVVSRASDRNGLKNIQARVDRWKGELSIDSNPGKGTKIKCEFPLASPK